MSRLTKDIREQMARKLVAYRYKEEAKAILYKDRALFERVYAHCYTDEVVKHMEAIEKAFPQTFDTRSSISVNAGGYSIRLGERFNSRWVRIEQAEDQPAKMMIGYRHRHAITDTKLAEEIKEHANKKHAFDDTCSTAYHEAMSVLNTMSTGKKLAEAWPEAMEVIGDLIPEDQRTLPVVQVSAINTKFKLPPKKAA